MALDEASTGLGRGRIAHGAPHYRLPRRSSIIAERLPVVGVRERVVGHRNAEELTQRLPALPGLEHQQPVGRDLPAHRLVVLVEDLDRVWRCAQRASQR